MKNIQVVLKSKPSPKYPEVDDIFESRPVALPTAAELQEDQVLLELLYLSIDAAMRIWITGY